MSIDESDNGKQKENKFQPNELDVIAAARSKLTATPSIGIAKLLAQLQHENSWILSEKRLKTILVANHLRKQPEQHGSKNANQGNGESSTSYIPTSHIDPQIAVPDGIRAKYFDNVKGKGLVADRSIRQGETIFVEDAFIAAPPGHAMQDVWQGSLCGQCFAPLKGSLVVACGQGDCQARFCTRLCHSRAQSAHHALLCSGQNPSIKPFLKFILMQKWLSLALVARTLARILLTQSSFAPASLSSKNARDSSNGEQKATLSEMMAHFDAFATVSELERRARNPGWDIERESFLRSMKEAHTLMKNGMDPRVQDRKGKWPLRPNFSDQVADSLFNWNAFLNMLGRANLNSEAQGGMYLVHSHLNHACEPNCTTTHPPNRHSVRQATKIAVLAKRDIAKDEELTISYLDPKIEVSRRRMLLWREYMFGPCSCTRCELEVSRLSEAEREAFNDTKSWTRDAHEERAVKERQRHAEMLDRLEAERDAKLKADGKAIPSNKELGMIEDELRTHLGF